MTPVTTREQAYQRMVAHFSQEGARFGHDGKNCVYRGEAADGTILRCAVGCLIPDSVDMSAFEGKSYNAIEGYLVSQGVVERHEEYPVRDGLFLFLAEAQRLHDAASERGYEVHQFVFALGQLYREEVDVTTLCNEHFAPRHPVAVPMGIQTVEQVEVTA